MIERIRRRLKSRSNKGDTLIEVIFALVIIGFIIMVAIQGALSANRSSVDARMRTQAEFYATYQIEGIRTYRNGVYWARDPLDASVNHPNLVNDKLQTFGMSVATGTGCPGAPSGSFYVDVNAAPANVNLVSGSGTVGPYTLENTAKLTQCNNTVGTVDYGADSVEVTTKISWTSASGKHETITLIDYLTTASVDH